MIALLKKYWWVVAGAIVLLLLFMKSGGIFKSVAGLMDSWKAAAGDIWDGLSGNTEAAAQAKNDVASAPEPDVNGMSITMAEARVRAASAYAAMQGIGTNVDDLFTALQGTNGGEDLQAIYKAFGAKSYYVLWDTMDLFGWMTAELGDTDKARMRTLWENAPMPYV